MEKEKGPAELIDIKTICAETGSSPTTVLSWIKFGVEGTKLKAKRYGRLWKSRRSDLAEFIESVTAKSYGS